MPDVTEPTTETSDVELATRGDGCLMLVLPNPGSTGHLWQVETSDGIELVGVASVARDGDAGDVPVGGGFDETYTLKGKGSITMVLRRPWEDGVAPWKRVVVRTRG